MTSPALPDALLSVLVVTSRPWTFHALVAQLAAIRWPRKELVIVENVPVFLERESPLVQANTWEAVHHRRVAGRVGVAVLRNQALSMATGEFVAWVDDDDWRHPDHVAKAVEEMVARDLAGIGPGASYWVDLAGMRTSFYATPAGLPVFGGTVFRRERVKFLDFPEGMTKGSDTAWMNRMDAAGLSVGSMEGFSTFVAVSHGGNVSNPNPYGPRTPHTAESLDAMFGTEGSTFGLVAHLGRLRAGRDGRVSVPSGVLL